MHKLLLILPVFIASLLSPLPCLASTDINATGRVAVVDAKTCLALAEPNAKDTKSLMMLLYSNLGLTMSCLQSNVYETLKSTFSLVAAVVSSVFVTVAVELADNIGK
jgi:hypothetical protein